MQCILTFNLFVSSSLFPLEVVVKSFDYFWKPKELFSKFCVNCLLMFYFVYSNSCALKYVNEASYCTCSLMALGVPEMCFWPGKTRKSLEVFEMHTYLWPGAQIWFRHKRKKLIAAFLLLHFIGGHSCLRYWNEFFQLCFMFSIEVFSYCALTETYAIGFQKWFDHEWIDFGVFCWKLASFVDLICVWTGICKKSSIVILFWRHQFFSMFSLRGILVCSLKMLVFLAIGFCNIDWKALVIQRILIFNLFCVFQPIFLGSSGETLWLLLKTTKSVFQVLC